MGANSSKSTEGSKTSSVEDLKGAGSDRNCALEDARKPIHRGPIHCVCAVGENSVATAGADQEVAVVNWSSRLVEGRLAGPTKDITKVCYSDTGAFIFAASRDRSIYSWKWPYSVPEDQNFHSGSNVNITTAFEGHSLGVTALDTSNDYPQLLCSGSRDNSVCLWDVDVGKPVSSMYVPRNLVTDLAWVPGEMGVVQSSEDKSVRVWDLTSCSTVQHFRARNQLQLCCAISADRQYILSGGSGCSQTGGQLVLWDRRNEKKPLFERHAHQEGVRDCQFLSVPGQNLVCSVGGDSGVRLWEAASLNEVCHGTLSESDTLTAVTPASPDLLVCSSLSSGLSFWTLMVTEDSDLAGFSLQLAYTCI